MKRVYALFLSLVLILGLSACWNEEPKDALNPLDLVSINGKIYEIIPHEMDYSDVVVPYVLYSEVLSTHGLSSTVNPDSIGKRIGTFQSKSGESVTVFDYSEYDGQSVVIVERDNKHYYGLFCNLDNNKRISIKELLDLYGITESTSIQEILVGSQTVTERKMINAFYDELILSELDDLEINSDSSNDIKIQVKGKDSDVVIFEYFPADNVMYKSLSYYLLSTEFLATINEIS